LGGLSHLVRAGVVILAKQRRALARCFSSATLRLSMRWLINMSWHASLPVEAQLRKAERFQDQSGDENSQQRLRIT